MYDRMEQFRTLLVGPLRLNLHPHQKARPFHHSPCSDQYRDCTLCPLLDPQRLTLCCSLHVYSEDS